MVSRNCRHRVGFGLARTRLVLGAALALGAPAAAAQAPPGAPPSGTAPAPGQGFVPDQLTVLRLVYSSIAALDHANLTGNYSVLRDLGAPGFQSNNTSATLGGIFQPLRSQNVDLSYALILTPTYEFPPAIVEGGLLRVRGTFPLRPFAIGFDFLFQNVSGQWRLFGVAVVPIAARQQPAPARRQ